jgi:hypothetical protein
VKKPYFNSPTRPAAARTGRVKIRKQAMQLNQNEKQIIWLQEAIQSYELIAQKAKKEMESGSIDYYSFFKLRLNIAEGCIKTYKRELEELLCK